MKQENLGAHFHPIHSGDHLARLNKHLNKTRLIDASDRKFA